MDRMISTAKLCGTYKSQERVYKVTNMDYPGEGISELDMKQPYCIVPFDIGVYYKNIKDRVEGDHQRWGKGQK